jgi:hypothetical protein
MQALQASFLVILMVALSTVACASQRTRAAQGPPSEAPAAAVAATDVNTLAGKWRGWYTGSSGASVPLEVDVKPDGTYTSRIGSAAGTGTFKVAGGKILASGHLLGPEAPFDRTAAATLMERNGRSVVKGEGKTDRGPYSFEMTKD